MVAPVLLLLLLSAPASNADNALACSHCSKTSVAVSSFVDSNSALSLVEYVQHGLCSVVLAPRCTETAATLLPAVLGIVKSAMSEQALCLNSRFCGATDELQSTVVDKAACDVCTFVVTEVKDFMADPGTQAAIVDAGDKTCSIFPADFSDDCDKFVDQLIDQVFAYVAGLDPAAACSSFCKSFSSVFSPLTSDLIVAHCSRIASSANSVCDNCKMAVLEVHSMLSNPDLQSAIVAYAKTMCNATGSWADRCNSAVDQYAPAFFEALTEQLNPDLVCVEVGMCPKTMWYHMRNYYLRSFSQ